MPTDIIDGFRLGTNKHLDDRYVVESRYDVSMYWYPGMQIYEVSTNTAYVFDGSTWEPWNEKGPVNIDVINGGTNWTNPTDSYITGGSY